MMCFRVKCMYYIQSSTTYVLRFEQVTFSTITIQLLLLISHATPIPNHGITHAIGHITSNEQNLLLKNNFFLVFLHYIALNIIAIISFDGHHAGIRKIYTYILPRNSPVTTSWHKLDSSTFLRLFETSIEIVRNKVKLLINLLCYYSAFSTITGWSIEAIPKLCWCSLWFDLFSHLMNRNDDALNM